MKLTRRTLFAGLAALLGLSATSLKAIAAPVAGCKLYARAGEIMTCLRGHQLARFRRDVFVGEIQKPDDCEPLSAIKVGDATCPTCGGAIFLADANGGPLHFIDGNVRRVGV